MLDDLIVGFILSKLLRSGDAQSPAVVFPPAPGVAPSPGTEPAPPPPPGPPPSSAQLPALPNAPTFPSQVTPPTEPQRQAPAGFKRSIEVWQVDPKIATQAGPALSGFGVGAEAVTIQLLESGFPKGWIGKRSATPEEAANAKRLLSQWKDGGVLFLGPATLTGRRAYRMTKHPIAPGSPSPSVPSAPAFVPGSTVTIPEVTITPGGAPAGPYVTTVRRGEGLATIAKRLGMPANAASATAIQKANVPQGPDALWTATALAKGGLQKKGRAGGLQPGDRLFLPANWAVDPSAL
jgi:hypothetical protein